MDPPPDYHPRYPGAGKLEHKVALVTGGDSGIGRAVSVLFAREGARVAIAYLDEHEDAEKTKKLVEDEGSEALLLPGDLGRKSHATGVVAQTVERFGRLDVLVNNASQQFVEPAIENIDEEQLRHLLETNIASYFFVTQAALEHLPRGGRIINTASVTAFKGSAALVDYSATRGAVLAFTRSASSQLAERGIQVNAVAPGPIWTPFIPGSFPADEVEKFGQDTPLGRPGQPWEVATSYLFLACDDGSYFTGQTLHPNGGKIVGS
jgi:NAD(P)-dependent dehydrogenase (short-subunit alcohol dehydrogenase family)